MSKIEGKDPHEQNIQNNPLSLQGGTNSMHHTFKTWRTLPPFSLSPRSPLPIPSLLIGFFSQPCSSPFLPTLSFSSSSCYASLIISPLDFLRIREKEMSNLSCLTRHCARIVPTHTHKDSTHPGSLLGSYTFLLKIKCKTL